MVNRSRRYLFKILATIVSAAFVTAISGTIIVYLFFQFFISRNDWFEYKYISRIKDEMTGKYVELGSLENFSSLSLVVIVFDDANDNRDYTDNTEPAIYVASVDWDKPIELTTDGRCYILNVTYGYGGVASPVWKDPNKGEELCFKIVPIPGPLGGWKPETR
jgi:hypothetical protein